MKLKETVPAFKDMNTVYWTFHRALEQQHEEAMMRALDMFDRKLSSLYKKDAAKYLHFWKDFGWG